MRHEERYDQQEPAQREDCRREHLTPLIQDSSPPTLAHADRRGTDLSGFGEGSTLTASQELRKAGKDLKAITDCEATGLGRIPSRDRICMQEQVDAWIAAHLIP